MIHPSLYRKPVPLDPVAHRNKRVGPLVDFSITSTMHASYVSTTEMPLAGLEFAIVFIETGERDAAGKGLLLPVAMLGVIEGENLFVEGTTWVGRYIPALIRRYPFATVRAPGSGAFTVLIDEAWPGISEDTGNALYEADGTPTQVATAGIGFLEMFEQEAARTREFCAWLQTLDVLRPMTADLSTGDGTAFSLKGFWAIDHARLNALPDALVLELHRNGTLRLLYVLQSSLGNMRFLIERKARHDAAAKAA